MLKYLSPNFNNRPDGIAIDMLIFHYTGMLSANEALERMCSPIAKVSAHYMIDENGRIFYSYVNKIGNDGWYLEEWKKDMESFKAKKSQERNNE